MFHKTNYIHVRRNVDDLAKFAPNFEGKLYHITARPRGPQISFEFVSGMVFCYSRKGTEIKINTRLYDIAENILNRHKNLFKKVSLLHENVQITGNYNGGEWRWSTLFINGEIQTPAHSLELLGTERYISRRFLNLKINDYPFFLACQGNVMWRAWNTEPEYICIQKTPIYSRSLMKEFGNKIFGRLFGQTSCDSDISKNQLTELIFKHYKIDSFALRMAIRRVNQVFLTTITEYGKVTSKEIFDFYIIKIVETVKNDLMWFKLPVKKEDQKKISSYAAFLVNKAYDTDYKWVNSHVQSGILDTL